jgi:hypothetical protein
MRPATATVNADTAFLPATLTDYYALLHLGPGCSAAEIRAAYRRLARRYHPDVNPAPEAARRMAAINEAYAVLGHPLRRRAYDLARGRAGPPNPAHHRSQGSGAPRAGTVRVPRLRALVPWTLALVLSWTTVLLIDGDGRNRTGTALPPVRPPAFTAAPAPQLTIAPQAEQPALLAFSADAALLATASRTGAITVWRTATGEPVATLTGHRDAVQSLVFLAEGRLLVSASRDQTTRLWDVTAGEELSRLRVPEEDGTALCLALSPAADLLAMAHVTDVIAVWSLVTHQKLVRLPLPPGAGSVTALHIAADASLLAATLADGRTALFRLPPMGEAETGNAPPMAGLVALLGTPFTGFDPRGGVVVLTRRGEELNPSADHGQGLRIQAANGPGTALATAFAVSADGRTAAWAGASGGGLVPVWPVTFWHATGARAATTILAHPVPALGLALAPDGALLATAARDGTVRLWRVPR